jgi:hypothetical protein
VFFVQLINFSSLICLNFSATFDDLIVFFVLVFVPLYPIPCAAASATAAAEPSLIAW